MKVTVYCLQHPMGYYRMIWPAMALQAYGYDVDIVDANAQPWFSVDPKTGELADVLIPETDVIVTQRVTQVEHVEAIRRWQKAGIRVIVDMDDDLSAITEEHNPGAFALLNGSTDGVSHKWAHVACQLADHVTVSTFALADKYGQRHTTVLPNCVPSAYLKIPRWKSDEKIIGWTGALKFRNTDPSVVGSAIGRLQDEGFAFGMVGPNDGIEKAFNLRKPLRKFGAQHFHDYPLAMSRFTVGIAPLKPTQFNLAKSWLKPLEFLSLGVPCVVSDMPEYRALVTGTVTVRMPERGILYARNPRQWYGHLRRILMDDNFREEQSVIGRETVKHLTYENRAIEWWNVWTGVGSSSIVEHPASTVEAPNRTERTTPDHGEDNRPRQDDRPGRRPVRWTHPRHRCQAAPDHHP